MGGGSGWWVVVSDASGVPVVVMPTQPLPGVPVDVMLAQPLPGVRGVHLLRHRRAVHLQLPGRLGPVVYMVLLMVEVQVVGPPLLPQVPRMLRVRLASGGCTGSSRFHGRRCGIYERSGVVG